MMKMLRNIGILLWIVFISAGCNLLEIREPKGAYHANGPYWDGPGQNFSVGHVLNYLQQLRTLSAEAIEGESERVAKAHADFKRPVDQVQYLLVLVALGASPENKRVMEKLVSELNQETAFMRTDVQELLFLIKALASSNMASQLQSPSSKIKIKAVEANAAELKEKLKACNDQSKTLAGQIQKLKDIERILNDRELNTEK